MLRNTGSVASSGGIDLDGLRRVANEPSSQAMYHQVLDTIGHDHSGTLYAET